MFEIVAGLRIDLSGEADEALQGRVIDGTPEGLAREFSENRLAIGIAGLFVGGRRPLREEVANAPGVVLLAPVERTADAETLHINREFVLALTRRLAGLGGDPEGSVLALLEDGLCFQSDALGVVPAEFAFGQGLVVGADFERGGVRGRFVGTTDAEVDPDLIFTVVAHIRLELQFSGVVEGHPVERPILILFVLEGLRIEPPFDDLRTIRRHGALDDQTRRLEVFLHQQR